ncbi:hypothetical protein [Candidatus Paracaedibacter symbiosus]|uniref:hypothetical protein n=1 Tax=Candidatus Paracaedibacter symbiosus TaxID=244582 RepID=UPI000509B130|nr:hypothetical protein [Candidatus Paracaedibacter symbiosus]
MDIIDHLVQKNPILQEKYNEEYHRHLESLKQKKKIILKEHEWWKEYAEEKVEEINIDLNSKYDFFVMLL